MRFSLNRSVGLLARSTESKRSPSLDSRSGNLQHYQCNIIHCRKFHSIQDNRHTWSMLLHLYQQQIKSTKKYACLMLNINDKNFKWFERHKYIWDNADLKVAVDGSANCLASRGLLHTADVISGDFDSIDANLITRLQSPRKAVKSRGYVDSNSREILARVPQIVETPCQRDTDFTKAIRVAMSLKPDIHQFFALYFIDGHRLDHLFGLVNTLHIIKKDIFIMNTKSNTVSWLLQPGNHVIHKPRGQELCFLLPFTGSTEVKTHGLQYELNPMHPTKFGGLVSTSNMCQEQRDKIVIDTNRELLWSIDMYDHKNKKPDDS